MRQVHWNEFVSMPAGTVFSHADQYQFGGLYVKGDTLLYQGKPSDYGQANLLPESNFACVLGDTKPIDLDEGTQVVMHPSGFGRDGLFEKDRHYWIWDLADLQRLAYWLLDPTKAAEAMNEDECVIWRGDRS